LDGHPAEEKAGYVNHFRGMGIDEEQIRMDLSLLQCEQPSNSPGQLLS
jgi:hypothetical protein